MSLAWLRQKATQLGAAKTVERLKKASTPDQHEFLQAAVDSGYMTPATLCEALKSNAPHEMHKGARRLRQKGIAPTVDLLMEDYRKSQSFQKLVQTAGLDESYFISLAEAEIKEHADS